MGQGISKHGTDPLSTEYHELAAGEGLRCVELRTPALQQPLVECEETDFITKWATRVPS